MRQLSRVGHGNNKVEIGAGYKPLRERIRAPQIIETKHVREAI